MATVTRPLLDGGWAQFDDASAVSRPSMEGGWFQQEAGAAPPSGGGIRNPLAGPLTLRNPLGAKK